MDGALANKKAAWRFNGLTGTRRFGMPRSKIARSLIIDPDRHCGRSQSASFDTGTFTDLKKVLSRRHAHRC